MTDEDKITEQLREALRKSLKRFVEGLNREAAEPAKAA